MSAVLTAVDDGFPLDRQVAQLRIPPHSVEAESSVLGGLLLDNGAWDRVADLLTDGDFIAMSIGRCFRPSARWSMPRARPM